MNRNIGRRLSTQQNDIVANAYMDTKNDPALLRFKTDQQGAERPNVDFFVYSVVNAEDVMTGAKPRMETIGPFQYVQTTEINGTVLVEDGFTTFSASKKYELKDESQKEMLKREVVVPNMFFKDLGTSELSAAQTEEYDTSAAAPLFIKVSAGQVLGSTGVQWKTEPLLQERMTFADFGGLGASEQKNVRMKTGQSFKAKGFRYIVQDGVAQYCAFDKDCASEAVPLPDFHKISSRSSEDFVKIC